MIRHRDCIAPEIGNLLTAYCFGRASESERQSVEAHLLECECCWREGRRLDAAVHVLDTDRSLMQSLTPADVAAAFGISGRLDLPFGGHRWHALAAGGLYAALFAIALLGEVAYQFDRYGRRAIAAAVAMFAGMFLASLVGMAADWRLTLKGSNKGLAASMAIFLLAALALYVGASLVLPPEPITQTQSSLQAYTAQAAYLKDIIYFFILKVVFLLPPFHFVLTMQRELQAGRHRLALGLFSGDKLSVTPRGAFFPRFWVLLLFFVVIVSISIFLHTNLMDHLKPAPFMNLFSNLILTRLMLYYALAAECLFWYYRALNELKRECLAAERIQFNGKGESQA
ncbi:MAG: zf-HC2 domain-containing protein [Acidobacteriota bacterium]|nr:zf-HC2 domain-containing protein [Acidobacteriota bacterium]